MTAHPAPGAPIELATLFNLRDAGGWPTRDGRRVKRGVIFRSTALDQLSDADAATLAGFHIRTIVDLRTEAERVASPDRPVPGARSIVADVLAGSAIAAPARMQSFFREPESAMEFLAAGHADDAMRSAYRESITLPSARAGYAAFLRSFLDRADTDEAVLVHCTSGKDRTGWATAVLLSLLGVSEDDVYRDYLLTNEQLVPKLEFLFARFAAHGASREMLTPVLGVDRSYLDEALAMMRAEYGTIEGYVTEGLGITVEEQQRLGELLLD